MHFKVMLSLIIDIWNCLKSEVVFFPVFPTLGVQNLFFPGRLLPVNTTVKPGTVQNPPTNTKAKTAVLSCLNLWVIMIKYFFQENRADNAIIKAYSHSDVTSYKSVFSRRKVYVKQLFTITLTRIQTDTNLKKKRVVMYFVIKMLTWCHM